MKTEQAFEIAVHTLYRVKAVAVPHMAAPALIRFADVRKRELLMNLFAANNHGTTFGVPAAELFQLAPHFLDRLVAHFPEDLAGLQQLKLYLQELEAVGEPLDFGLLRIEDNTEGVANLLHTGQAFFEDRTCLDESNSRRPYTERSP